MGECDTDESDFFFDTFPRGVAVEAREVHLRVKTMTVRKARIGNGSMDDKKKL